MATTSTGNVALRTCRRCRPACAITPPTSASPSTAMAIVCKWSTTPVRSSTATTCSGFSPATATRGVAFLRADVGDRYVLQALKQHGGLLGGEASGHLLCMDKVTTGDGIIVALLALDVLQRRGTTLAQARASLHRVPQTTVNIPAAGGAALVARDV